MERLEPADAVTVSVIVPCYNLGPYVDEAVLSVLGQTFQDVEIVVVNDGSTDAATNRLLADYRRPKTRVLTTENRGLAAARNLAIASTTGRYLCALDADDTLEPTYLAKAVRILDADPSLTFVSSWVQLFGEEAWLWKQERCDLPALLAECTVMTAALVRRDAVLALGGYDGAMPAQGNEDWDLWLSLVERGHRGTIIPEALFNYRQRAGSMRRACSEGKVRLDLIRYLVDKHADAYRRHLADVLLWRDVEIADLLSGNYELQRLLETERSELEGRRQERDRLRREVAARAGARAPSASAHHAAEEMLALRDRAARLDQALERAHAEIHALRASMSWKVTWPLRLLWGRLLRLRNGGAG